MPLFVLSLLIACTLGSVAFGAVWVAIKRDPAMAKYWAALREPYLIKDFKAQHPATAKAYQRMGIWRSADMADLHARGWDSLALHDLEQVVPRAEYFETHQHQTPECTCAGTCRRGSIWTAREITGVLSGHAFAALEHAWAHCWPNIPRHLSPVALQRRYDACGDLAPLTLLAGLTDAEVTSLAANGSLDRESLTAMTALRGVSVPAGLT